MARHSKTTRTATFQRAILVTCVLLAVFGVSRLVGWYTVRSEYVQAQRAVFDRVKELGGQVYYDNQLRIEEGGRLVPDASHTGDSHWLGSLIGRDWVHDIFYISLAEFRTDQEYGLVARSNQVVDDSILELAAELPNLKWAALSGTAISNQGMARLCQSQPLERLWLGQTAITDQTLAEIARCQSVTHVSIEGTPTSDTGLAELVQLPKLEFLSLGSPYFTPQGLAALSQARHLKELHLDRLPVNDLVLAALSRLPDLEVLSLRQTAITDYGVQQLSRLKKLRELHLDGTALTDRAFASDFNLPSLETLTLEQTAISDAGLRGLSACAGLSSLRAGNSSCTLTGLCDLFTELLDRSLAEALSAIAEVRLDASGDVVSLTLTGIPVADSDLDIIHQLPQLQWLALAGSQITDEGAAKLASFSLPKLSLLNLNNSRVSDLGLEELVQLPSLVNLHVAGTDVSQEKVGELQATHRSLSIYTTDLAARQKIVRSPPATTTDSSSSAKQE